MPLAGGAGSPAGGSVPPHGGAGPPTSETVPLAGGTNFPTGGTVPLACGEVSLQSETVRRASGVAPEGSGAAPEGPGALHFVAMIEPELRRIVQLLERLARVNKVPNRTIERQAGFAHGTLNRLFGDKMDLKMRHVLAILQAVGMAVPDFFALAYSKGMEDVPAEQVIARAQMFGAGDPPPPRRALAPEEMEAIVSEVMKRVEQKGAGRKRPKKS